MVSTSILKFKAVELVKTIFTCFHIQFQLSFVYIHPVFFLGNLLTAYDEIIQTSDSPGEHSFTKKPVRRRTGVTVCSQSYNTPLSPHN